MTFLCLLANQNAIYDVYLFNRPDMSSFLLVGLVDVILTNLVAKLRHCVFPTWPTVGGVIP